jgi:hypothetical protein
MSDETNQCKTLVADNVNRLASQYDFTHDSVIVGFGRTQLFEWWLIK